MWFGCWSQPLCLTAGNTAVAKKKNDFAVNSMLRMNWNITSTERDQEHKLGSCERRLLAFPSQAMHCFDPYFNSYRTNLRSIECIMHVWLLLEVTKWFIYPGKNKKKATTTVFQHGNRMRHYVGPHRGTAHIYLQIVPLFFCVLCLVTFPDCDHHCKWLPWKMPIKTIITVEPRWAPCLNSVGFFFISRSSTFCMLPLHR